MMSQANCSPEYIAYYQLNTVLHNVPQRELKPGRSNMYRLCLQSLKDEIDILWFYVPEEHVITYYADSKNPNHMTYDVILLDEEYTVQCLRMDGIECSMQVSRDLLTDAYYKRFPERYYQMYDLMTVPETSVMDATDHCAWCNVSILGSKIEENTLLSFVVSRNAIHKIGMQEMTGNIDDAHVLAPYVHIALDEAQYTVTYANKKTHWHSKQKIVTREQLREDYLQSMRASHKNMSFAAYNSWLQQKYVNSVLF